MKIRQSKRLEGLISRGIVRSDRGRSANPIDIIMLIMLEEGNCHAWHIVRKMKKEWEFFQLRSRLAAECARSEGVAGDDQQRIRFFVEVYNALEMICREVTKEEGELVINTAHYLLFVLRNEEFVASQVLREAGIDMATIEEYVKNYPADEDYYPDMQALDTVRTVRIESSENKHPLSEHHHDATKNDMIKNFGSDLTLLAREGKIDPIIGREQEIERLIQILGRRKKNNPILIGEAGVGKSAIVEGLALRIVARDVPHILQDKRIFSLDVASLVAGTKYRGEFEERINELLHQLSEDENTILFIDEIHTIVGAGSTQGSLDTANILKPALARGHIQCIGATTLDEFRESIENDAALERRFQKILIEPTTPEQTLNILQNIKSHYEQHHSVIYTDQALAMCVELADRYITDRHFPDKAVDLMDEVGARANIFAEHDTARVQLIEKELAEVARERQKALASFEYEQAQQTRFEEVALRNKLDLMRETASRRRKATPLSITAEHVAQVVSAMTGIPVSSVTQDERGRLATMSERLSESVVGQEKAIGSVVKAILRSRSGLNDPTKPIGVFLFVGPTGVGKTLLAKQLATQLFDRPEALVRIDMSEYSEHHNISRLIGSPPGYVGYNRGGQLTERIRRQPYSVVLFDEIEKAHPDVFNLMLQLFDDGELTDGLGRKVDFRNTVIIMTSNVGSQDLVKRSPRVGFRSSNEEHEERQSVVSIYRKALERTFAPEFINRIDEVVVFNTLTDGDVERIVEIEMKEFNGRASRLGYTIGLSECAKRRLVELGHSARYGVRSLKRIILEHIEEPLAEMIVENRIKVGDHINICMQDNKISLLTSAC